MTYPERDNEAERLRHLRELCILGTAPSEVLDQICSFARELLAVPMVALTLLDERSQWLYSRSGFSIDRTPREHAFCNHTILGEDVMAVPDAATDPRFAENPLVSGEMGIRFYAGVPLAFEPGVPVATLCCMDTKPRRFSERHYKVLKDLGAIALSQLNLHRATRTDELTGLPNRRALLESLDVAIEAAAAGNHKVALFFIDLDRFKEINDTLGHDAGDALLKTVADRIRARLPVDAMAARIGGDEFAALLPAVLTSSDAEGVAEDLLEALRAPININETEATCQSTIGISIFPDDAVEVGPLLKASDIALYAAKDAGRDRYAVFQPELNERIQIRVAKLSRAREALAEKQIVPFYQPKIAVSTGRVVGFEALLRLVTSEGIQTPAAIEDAFSDPSLMNEIGRVMLASILKDMRSWSERGVPFGSVALNVTQWDLTRDFPRRLLAGLADAKLTPGRLQVEITESAFLGESTDVIRSVIEEIRSAGIEVALDDFGTGFASLTHLRSFPVDWLKLDRSFIGKVDSEQESAAIVHGVISLAQSLGLGLVAEGVETKSQLDFLKRRRCDLAQGFLFSPAIPGDQVAGFLSMWSQAPPRAVA